MQPHYDKALNEALVWIKSQYDPLAVIVSGSIVRGNPDNQSDFDIYVIHQNSYKQRVQRFFNNVPCEIFINHPKHVYEYFEIELHNNRPVTANMLSTGVVVIGEENEEVRKLVEESKKYVQRSALVTGERITIAKYRLALKYEDAADTNHRDPLTTAYLLTQFINDAIEYVFLQAKHPLPRIKERLPAIAHINPQASVLINRFLSSGMPGEKLQVAAELVKHLTGQQGFFEWESSKVD